MSGSPNGSWDEWVAGLDGDARRRAEELRDSFARRGWGDLEFHARTELSRELARWSPEQQLTYLQGLTEGLERDIRASLDPSFAIGWVIEDGDWFFRCFRSQGWFGDAADLDQPDSELERQDQILDIVAQVTDNMWPDEWTDYWPLCPVHRNHPLNPAINHGLAAWVCNRDHRIATPIGDLQAATDDRT